MTYYRIQEGLSEQKFSLDEFHNGRILGPLTVPSSKTITHTLLVSWASYVSSWANKSTEYINAAMLQRKKGSSDEIKRVSRFYDAS